MRYTPVEKLKTGMILGQDIHDASGRLLIGSESALTEENITYIVKMGVPGVFVQDEFVQNLNIPEYVKPQVKREALRMVQEFFGTAITSGKVKAFQKNSFEAALVQNEDEEKIKANVHEVVDNVLGNDDVMYNVMEVKTYDDYTYFHSVNVGILAGIIGARCGLSEEELEKLVTAGFLHDIGKVFIGAELLNAQRPLTEDERIEMMEHPQKGYAFLTENFNFTKDITRAVLEHHEWYNGWGYPNKIVGEQASVFSRILKAADVYDAMTSKRPYHPPYLPSEVMEYIMARSGTEFDPNIVQIMSNYLSIYPVGCEVVLSDGRGGIVVENHPGLVMRPTVKLFENGTEINLAFDRKALSLTIVKVVM